MFELLEAVLIEVSLVGEDEGIPAEVPGLAVVVEVDFAAVGEVFDDEDADDEPGRVLGGHCIQRRDGIRPPQLVRDERKLPAPGFRDRVTKSGLYKKFRKSENQKIKIKKLNEKISSFEHPTQTV